ncbi:MAG: hypothetical protein KGK30_09450, partial [Elusimicrobia bacterium]|nr:hypothetical protein [Elusimicrobiota bacterium]
MADTAATAEPHAVLERYLAAPASARPRAFAELRARVHELAAERSWERAAWLLRRAVLPGSDYTTLQSLHRDYVKLKPKLPAGPSVKLAVLGGFTTGPLSQAIELALFSMGGSVELYEADYGVYRQEILDPASALYAFEPEVVFLATSWRDLGRRPGVG